MTAARRTISAAWFSTAFDNARWTFDWYEEEGCLKTRHALFSKGDQRKSSFTSYCCTASAFTVVVLLPEIVAAASPAGFSISTVPALAAVPVAAAEPSAVCPAEESVVDGALVPSAAGASVPVAVSVDC